MSKWNLSVGGKCLWTENTSSAVTSVPSSCLSGPWAQETVGFLFLNMWSVGKCVRLYDLRYFLTFNNLLSKGSDWRYLNFVLLAEIQNYDVVDDFDDEEEEDEEVYWICPFLLEKCKTIPMLKGNGLFECLRRIANLLRLCLHQFPKCGLWYFLRWFLEICEVESILQIVLNIHTYTCSFYICIYIFHYVDLRMSFFFR